MSEKTTKVAEAIHAALDSYWGGPRSDSTPERLKEMFDWVAYEMDHQLNEGMSIDDIATYWKLWTFPNAMVWAPEEHDRLSRGEPNRIQQYWGHQGQVRNAVIQILAEEEA